MVFLFTAETLTEAVMTKWKTRHMVGTRGDRPASGHADNGGRPTDKAHFVSATVLKRLQDHQALHLVSVTT